MKLFEREISEEEAEVLVPWSMGRESQEQARELERRGYQPVYDQGTLAVLKRLGAVVARTHTDGALWIYTRCIPHGERYAVWAWKSDLDTIETLRKLATASVWSFEELLSKLPATFTEEQRDAAEGAIVQFLESL